MGQVCPEFVSPSNFNVETESPVCGCVWRHIWGDEMTMRMGLCLYIREIPCSIFHVGNHQENNLLRFRWADNGSVGTQALHFSGSKIRRNKFQLFISHPVGGSLLQQAAQTKTDHG